MKTDKKIIEEYKNKNIKKIKEVITNVIAIVVYVIGAIIFGATMFFTTLFSFVAHSPYNRILLLCGFTSWFMIFILGYFYFKTFEKLSKL